MKKNVFTYALFALLLICVMVSCNNSKTPEVIAKNPATLKVNYFREYYAVGDDVSKLDGSLSYTAEGGSSITQVDIKSEEVKKDGFDTTTTGEGKTLKLTYKGIDVVVTYHVVKMLEFDLYAQQFIVADNTTLVFKDGNKVDKYVWNNWDQYFDYTKAAPTPKEYDYTVGISSSGRTIVRVDNWNYYPDENGGLHSYPSEEQYFYEEDKYVPDMSYFYVSTGKEDHRSAEAAKGKYLVMKYDIDSTAYIWFTNDVTSGTLTSLSDTNAIKVTADKMSFGVGGVFMTKVEGTTDSVDPNIQNAKKNLTIILNKDGYGSEERAFTFVSYSDTNYRGYSYTMKLSDVAIPTT